MPPPGCHCWLEKGDEVHQFDLLVLVLTRLTCQELAAPSAHQRPIGVLVVHVGRRTGSAGGRRCRHRDEAVVAPDVMLLELRFAETS